MVDSNDPAVTAAIYRCCDCTIRFGFAVVGRYLKRKAKHPQSEARVRAVFNSWARGGDFREVVGGCVGAFFKRLESRLGKPYAQWNAKQREHAWREIADMFDEISSVVARGRGRPPGRRTRGTQGLIHRAMLEGEIERKRDLKRELQTAKKAIEPWIKGYALGKWVNAEERKRWMPTNRPPRWLVGSAPTKIPDGPHEAREQMRKRGTNRDEVKRRVVAEAVREFLDEYRFPAKWSARLAKHYHRSKHHMLR